MPVKPWKRARVVEERLPAALQVVHCQTCRRKMMIYTSETSVGQMSPARGTQSAKRMPAELWSTKGTA